VLTSKSEPSAFFVIKSLKPNCVNILYYSAALYNKLPYASVFCNSFIKSAPEVNLTVAVFVLFFKSPAFFSVFLPFLISFLYFLLYASASS